VVVLCVVVLSNRQERLCICIQCACVHALGKSPLVCQSVVCLKSAHVGGLSVTGGCSGNVLWSARRLSRCISPRQIHIDRGTCAHADL
jgi:hypothetical protein